MDIPHNGVRKSGIYGVSGFESEFANDLGRVYCVAPVMAGAVLDEGGKTAVGTPARVWSVRVHDTAEVCDDLQVGMFTISPYVISLAVAPALQDKIDSKTVILYMQPVPHILSVPVDGQGLSF